MGGSLSTHVYPVWSLRLLTIMSSNQGAIMVKKFSLAALAAIMAVFAVAIPTASADVPRYQSQKATIEVSLSNGALVHTFNVDVNPCDDSFVGTGTSPQGIPWTINETVTGHLKDGVVDFRADYGDSSKGYAGWEQFVGYQWFST